MAMISIEELMKASITDEDLAAIDLGTAEEASARSLRAFVAQQTGSDAAENKESRGLVHFTGPAVVGHSAPIGVIGDALKLMQKAVTAIGAAREGMSSFRGQISPTIKARTELRMESSPLAGSIVISVKPSMPRFDDLYPNGQLRIGMDDEDLRPLADICLEDFINIISSTTDESPACDGLIDLLSEFGPRTSSAIRKFCSSLSEGSLDVDFKWEEPKRKPLSGAMSHTRAKYVSDIIENAEIDAKPITLVGALWTSTMSEKDKLRIRFDDGSEKTLTLGSIESTDLSGFHTGQKVKVVAERRVGRYAGGREREWLVGVSIEPAE